MIETTPAPGIETRWGEYAAEEWADTQSDTDAAR